MVYHYWTLLHNASLVLTINYSWPVFHPVYINPGENPAPGHNTNNNNNGIWSEYAIICLTY